MAQKIGGTSTGLGLSFAVSGMANAEGTVDNDIYSTTESSTISTHGKNVYTDYSVTGIPVDARCLFRSAAQGACIRSGKPIPNEDLQSKLDDDLRTMSSFSILEEVPRDTRYQIRSSRSISVINGSKFGISWYLVPLGTSRPVPLGTAKSQPFDQCDQRLKFGTSSPSRMAGGLIAIAEYGQEYGEDPVQVLYHGFGHYDALQIPGKSGPMSRL